MNYGYALDREALAKLLATRPARQGAALHAFDLVAAHPFADADLELPGDEGVPVFTRFFVRPVVTFVVDHAAREVRFTDVGWLD